MYGIDVLQTRDYIQITLTAYLTGVMHDYVWLQDLQPANVDQLLPVSLDIMKKLDLAVLPSSEAERRAIEWQQGFKYCVLLGKLLFAMVCGHCETSYHISKLRQVMSRPAAIHFQALKPVAIYLVRTRHEGPIYWRPAPHPDLPVVPRELVPLDVSSRLSPWQPRTALTTMYSRTQIETTAYEIPSEWEGLDSSVTELAHGLVSTTDTDHAADLRHRRSYNGSVTFLHGGLIDFKTRLQTFVAQSSSEAELGGVNHSGKRTIYIRHILEGLRLRPAGATNLLVDNEAARYVTFATGVTRNLRHVEVQQFAIQDWQQKKKWLTVRRIDGSVNPSDILTKGTLSLLLHARHIHRLYGYHGPTVFTPDFTSP
jgi:hypothetical protein